MYSCKPFGPAYKPPVDANKDGHDSKAGAACGNGFAGVVSFPCQSAHGVAKIPKIFKGLLLHFGEQRIIANNRKLVCTIDVGNKTRSIGSMKRFSGN